jgi:FlaA1/EpsC-like NDP-sugar epimerase
MNILQGKFAKSNGVALRSFRMVASDAVVFVVAHLLAYLIRFEFTLHRTEIWQFMVVLPWLVPLKIVVFFIFGLYKDMWRYTSVRDFWRLAQACFLSMLAIMVAVLFIHRFEGFSRAVYLLDGALTFLLAGSLRMAIRSYLSSQTRVQAGIKYFFQARHRKEVLIIGAGDAGEKILREIFDNYQLHYHVAGFVDDDSQKQGRSIHGIPILGSVEELPMIVENEKIEEVLIAIPSASGEQMRRIVDICKLCGVFYKTLPGIGEIIDGHVSVKILRDVRYDDLLGRPPVLLNIESIRNYLDGRTVLVTGCGGSIGSELCRQIVRFQPRSIILLDSSEVNLFQIQMELQDEMYYHKCEAISGHVQDKALITSVFQKYHPQVVFHAAAYKHVPMLEKNPWETVTNNILGSQVIMEMSIKQGVERFVLVSTDKAVRPINVMGASKRIDELLLQSFQGNGTRFMAVRFGNVLGSSGSVIPLFRRQIDQGGPVTVSHPDVTRYFMTITEASQLIIQAGAMGDGGEIFILRMGTPVKILDMARDLIRLSGKEPDKDIKIVFTGLREGEKLCEELISVGEEIGPTKHEKIMVLRSGGFPNGLKSPAELQDWLNSELKQLYDLSLQYDSQAIKRKLQEIVPEYSPQDTESIFR